MAAVFSPFCVAHATLCVSLQPSHKTFKIKRKLGKAAKQCRPVPHWIRMRTDNKIRCVCSPL